MDAIVNNTGRAILAVAIIIFCIGTIVWLVLYGHADNSLHQSSLSWSYTLLAVSMAAIGLNITVDAIASLLNIKKPETQK